MAGSRFTLEVQPRIPAPLARLDELANNLVYSWDRRVRCLFARLDRALWAACGSNPRVFLRRVSQADPRRGRRGPRLPRGVPARAEQLRRLHGARPATRVRAVPRSGRRPGRVFLRRVRPARELPDLLRRPRHPRRRPLQGRQRPRPPLRRRRPAVPQRLLHPDHRRPRQPDLADRALRLPRPADPAGGRRRRAAAHRPRFPGTQRRGARLEGARRPYPPLPARHRRGREQRGGPSHHAPALRRRPRDAPGTGDRARHRRHARAAAPRPEAHRLAHQRGPRGLPGAGALPRVRAAGPHARQRAGDRRRRHRVHHAHAGARRSRHLRHRRCSRPTSAVSPRASASRCTNCSRSAASRSPTAAST